MFRGSEFLFSRCARHFQKLAVVLSLVMLAPLARAQESANWTVTTFAGNSTLTGSADGNGTAATFYGPRGIAIDKSGTLYVADTFNHTIRKISSGGIVTTWAGAVGQAGYKDATGTSALFNYPAGLAIDANGTVYVADSSNNVIRKITSDGTVTTLAGSSLSSGADDGVGTAATFNQPVGIAVDSKGIVYVVDSGNSELRKIATDGTVTTIQPTVGSPQFNNPYGVTVDVHGKLYVADTFNNVVCTVATDGTVSQLAGSSKNLSGSADGTASAASFSGPSAIALSPSGTLFVTESGNSEIRAIDSTTQLVTTVAGTASSTGTTDGTGDAALFNAPQGIAAGSDGALYVCDTLNSTIRKLVRGVPAQDTSPRFSNIATRSYVGTGDNVLIGGFIIGGTTPKKVLIRASGPALVAQGVSVTSALVDPILNIYQGSNVIATNDDWGSDPVNATAIAQANQSTGTNWPAASKDAAVILTLAPGGYTAIVSGKDNAQGVALVEVFELSNDGTSRLTNISTRSRVQTGDQVQIAGFIISGNSPKHVLIRAGGPFLAQYFSNQSEALADPVIQLYQGSTQIASNDDWSSDPTNAALIQQAFTAAGAVSYTLGSKDAAIVTTLAPGGYTAIVSGKNGGQGIALIEVQEVP